MNIWDFSKDTAQTGDLNKNLIELLDYVKTMPSGDMRLIMEVSTAQLAVSLGVMSQQKALMNTLKGLAEEDKTESDKNPN
jgi:hypothetical protein